MFKEKMVLVFHALTPVHMGSGTSVSYVDNPIQREKHTDFPILASSGIKGVVREMAERTWNSKTVNDIFGPKEQSEEQSQQFASCVSFTDAKILLFPVRSVRGVFAYVTCPMVLKRFSNELKIILGEDLKNEIPEKVNDSEIIVSSDSTLRIDNKTVALEEFVFKIDASKNVDKLAGEISRYLPEGINLKERMAIVSDDVFKDFVRYAVEIRTRIRIDQTTGTVVERALFNMELVPAESVFYGFLFINDSYALKALESNDVKEGSGKLLANDVKKKLRELLDGSLIQLGGDETLGMGLMKVKCWGS